MTDGTDGSLSKWAVVAYVLGAYNGVLGLAFFLFHNPGTGQLWPAFALIGSVSAFLAPVLNDR
jgi:hypothetical protein